MRRFMLLVLAVGYASGLTARPVEGQAGGQESSTLGFGVGVFDTSASDEKSGFGAFEEGLVWRGATNLAWGIGPMGGASGNEDGAWWAYLGVRRPFHLRGCWEAGPSFGPVYYQRSDGKNLGQELELRSGLEVNCQRGRRTSIGFEFYHLSNATLSDVNPGANSLWVIFSVPLGR